MLALASITARSGEAENNPMIVLDRYCEILVSNRMLSDDQALGYMNSLRSDTGRGRADSGDQQ
jgi:hypothetical protein